MNNSRNISLIETFDDTFQTRKVLFEKYSNLLKKCLLTDFDSAHWRQQNVNINSVINGLSRINESIYGESFYSADDANTMLVTLSNCTHFIKNAYIHNNQIYGDIFFAESPKAKEFKELFELGFIGFQLRATGYRDYEPQAEEEFDREYSTRIVDIITWDLILKN